MVLGMWSNLSNKQQHYVILGLALALSVRIIYLLVSPKEIIQSDALGYHESAIRLLYNATFSIYQEQPNAFITPGFPLFLSLIYAIFGTGEFAVNLVYYFQALISTCTVLLAFLIGYRLNGFKAGVIALAISAIYPPFIWANTQLLTEVLFTFSITLFVYILTVTFSEPSVKHHFISGLVLGITSLIRPTPAPYLLIMVFLLFIKRKKVDYQFLKLVGLAVIGFLIVMSPWWIRNFELYNRFVPFSTEGGNPFLIGTHPWFIGWEETNNNLPVVADEFARNKMWYDKGKEIMWRELNSNPIRYIKWLTIGKLRAFWAPYFGSPTFYTLFLHVPIFLLGMLFIVKDFIYRKHLELSLFICFFTFVHIVYLPISRYSFPIIPLMIVFAGVEISRFKYLWSGITYSKYKLGISPWFRNSRKQKTQKQKYSV
jgi:4-amino-4-deoxy-L-arabinose transferase-like glycosyltransferase